MPPLAKSSEIHNTRLLLSAVFGLVAASVFELVPPGLLLPGLLPEVAVSEVAVPVVVVSELVVQVVVVSELVVPEVVLSAALISKSVLHSPSV